MTPCGYTDSEWRRMGVKNASEVPAALKRIRAEEEAKGQPDLPPAEGVEPQPEPEIEVEKPQVEEPKAAEEKPAKVAKEKKPKAKGKKKK